MSFEIPRAGVARLRILDLAGRRVATLVNGMREAGRHAESWRGRSERGEDLAAGLYFAVLEFEGDRQILRIVRLP